MSLTEQIDTLLVEKALRSRTDAARLVRNLNSASKADQLGGKVEFEKVKPDQAEKKWGDSDDFSGWHKAAIWMDKHSGDVIAHFKDIDRKYGSDAHVFMFYSGSKAKPLRDEDKSWDLLARHYDIVVIDDLAIDAFREQYGRLPSSADQSRLRAIAKRL